MRHSQRKSVPQSWRKLFLILGLVLLVAGFLLIIAYSSSIVERVRVFAESVNVTTTGVYYSDSFQAEEGDLIGYELAATNRSILGLKAFNSSAGGFLDIYDDYHDDENAALHGVNYTGTFLINLTNTYSIYLSNSAFETTSPNHDAPRANNTFSGSFYLMRMPNYYPYLLTAGEALLATSCGLLLIPALSYVVFQAKRLGIAL